MVFNCPYIFWANFSKLDFCPLQVSEGTPSPSILNSLEPSFTPRKSLAYEESSSQDGQHTSFEDERKISITLPEVEPNKEVKTEPNDDVNEDKTEDKTGPITEINKEVIDEPETVVKTEPITDIRSETEAKTEVVDEPKESEAAVNVESENEVKVGTDLSVESGNNEIKTDADTIEKLNSVESGKSMTTQETIVPDLARVKHEPIEAEPESLSLADNASSCAMSTDNVQSSNATDSTIGTVEEPMDTNSTSSSLGFLSYVGKTGGIPGLDVSMEEESESVSEQMETNDIGKPSNQVPESVESNSNDVPVTSEHNDSNNEKSNDSSEVKTEASEETNEDKFEPVMESEPIQTIQPVRCVTPELLEPGFSHLVPPSQSASQLHLSPTSFSRLSQINLVIKQEPVSITPEVLEIGSNASTPTRDELPSPEDSLL